MLPLTRHARFEMVKRSITEDEVKNILEHPQQKIRVDENREIWQNKVEEKGKIYVIRVVIEMGPLRVITVYKSSKVKKYWRETS